LAPLLEDDAAGVDDDAELEVVDELLPLLLQQAASAATLSTDSATGADFLQITIQLLLR
jgi:hypothetical protein